jgi:NTP pyrophosphatase (non-canonical NTP hydrolase)
MTIKKIKTMKNAQGVVKKFAESNGWKDEPNIDKFDHLHEELLEMSRFLRYKNPKQRLKTIKENREVFLDGIGDLFFGTCRLANQLGIDIEEAFNFVKNNIIDKYKDQHEKKREV